MLRAWPSVFVFCLACPSPVDRGAAQSAPAPAKPKPETKATAKSAPAAKAESPQPTPETKAESEASRGKLLPNAPIPLDKFIGADPPTAESFLGDPAAKGRTKDTCLRFVPEKTWFRCKHTWQRYADKTGTAEAIEVTYEDGKAVSIAFVQLAGEGAFNPVEALKAIGVELPDPPKLSRPEANVKLWSWWNSAARLVIGGRQYRVEVSIVDDAWANSKVDIILNDPLNDAERAKVFEVKPQRPAG